MSDNNQAIATLNEYGLTEAWNVYQANDSSKREESIIIDMVRNLIKYESLSDKQVAFMRKLLSDISTRAERAAKRATQDLNAADVPTGRLTITAKIVSIKLVQSQWGEVNKLLLVHESGYKVYGSCPAALNPERGQLITLTATIKPSPDDPKFGFFNRPSNASLTPTESVTTDSF